MRGFTLIETLIYLALFSFLVTGAIASLMSMRENAGHIESSARLTDEGHFILERIRYEVERAKSVEVVGTPRLVVTYEESMTSFYLEKGTLMEETNGNALSLIEPTSSVQGLTFSTNADHGVSISFELHVRTDKGSSLSDRFSQVVYPVNSL